MAMTLAGNLFAQRSRFIGESLSADRMAVYLVDKDTFIPLVADIAPGAPNTSQIAHLSRAESPALEALVGRLRDEEGVILETNPEFLLPLTATETREGEAMLAVALRSSRNFLGVLIVEGAADELREQQAETIEFAELLALALESAESHEGENHGTCEAEVFLEVGTALTETTELQNVLATVARNSARATGFERCSIFVLNEDGALIPTMSQFADGRVDAEAWKKFQSSRGDFLEAMATITSGQPAAYENLETTPKLASAEWITSFGAESLLFIPLQAWGESFGVLVLDHQVPRPITPEEITIAQAVAAHGSVAIGVAKLLEKERESRREAERISRGLALQAAQQAAVARLGQMALSSIELPALMQETTAELARILNVEYVKLTELQPGGETLLLRAGAGWRDGLVGTATIGASLDSQAGFTLASREPVIVENLETETRFRSSDLLSDHDVVSGMSVVIGMWEHPYGVLGVHSTQERIFTPDDVSFLQSLANLIAGTVERTKAEAEIRESQERFQTIIATASDAIISIDDEHRILVFNQKAEAMFGYSAKEVLGGQIEVLFLSELRDKYAHNMDEFLRQEISKLLDGHRLEMPAQRKDGDTFTAEISLSSLDVGGDRILTAIMRDVTKHQEADQAIRESEQRYRNLFERSPIALWEEDFSAVGAWLEDLRESGVKDLREYLTENPSELAESANLIRVLDVNPAAVQLIGATRSEELLGNFLPTILTTGLRESLIEQFTAIWTNLDHYRFEMAGSTVTGDQIDLELHWAANRIDDQLDLSCVIIAMDDITQRKMAEQGLIELARSKDELIASVSHELRTPLTGIVGFTQLLQDSTIELTPEERQDMINLVALEATDIANIVEDLLVAARTEIGGLYVSTVSVDLLAQMSQVLEAWDQRLDSQIALNGSTIHALGDPSRIRQIVRNLITNALRYGGESVSVELSEIGSTTYARVIDNGPEIPLADQTRIFEAYQRAHTEPGQPGSVGLGLAVSRELAHLMNGDLIYRHEPGRSIFELSLPVSPKAES